MKKNINKLVNNVYYFIYYDQKEVKFKSNRLIEVSQYAIDNTC